jgi:hypothetical protein
VTIKYVIFVDRHETLTQPRFSCRFDLQCLFDNPTSQYWAWYTPKGGARDMAAQGRGQLDLRRRRQDTTAPYRYPFVVPAGFALACQPAADGPVYCQVAGCTAVLESARTARRHLQAQHADSSGMDDEMYAWCGLW